MSAPVRSEPLPGPRPARWWSPEGARFRCEVCPRRCLLSPGQRGFCGVRSADAEGLRLDAWGRVARLEVDRVERLPLFHYLPGSRVLSVDAAGRTLACRACADPAPAPARRTRREAQAAAPRTVVERALGQGCAAVAFGRADPVPGLEYVLDVAAACRETGLRVLARTSGYVREAPRQALFEQLDAVTIDLKAFSEAYYRRWCLGHLQPVLETIEHAVRDSDCWVELSTTLVAGVNDQPRDVDALTRWISDRLGPDVPLHLVAALPGRPASSPPLTTLRRCRAIGLGNGLRFVYLGNVLDAAGGSTWCADCGELLIRRLGPRLAEDRLGAARCPACGVHVPGCFGRVRAGAPAAGLA